MAINLPTCFISYSHADADMDVIEFLMQEISLHAKQEIHYFLDVELGFGKSFKDFMGRIDDVDVVLVLLTPSYKQKTIERRCGVYEEFKKILKKFETSNAAKDEQTIHDNPSVIPILLSGTRETAIPDAFKDARSLNLSGLVVRKQSGGVSISGADRQKYEPFFAKIAKQIIVKDSLATPSFRQTQQEYFDHLFVNLKDAEKSVPPEVLLATEAYEIVRRQASFFVVGRKGAGKSTLTRMLRTLNPDYYAGVINIRAENLNLQMSSE